MTITGSTLTDRLTAELLSSPEELLDRVCSVAFLTSQGARHPGRTTTYRNTVASIRVGSSVGSCAVAPDSLDESILYSCIGSTIRDLIDHPEQAVRVAALDAAFMEREPWCPAQGDRLTLPPGNSLDRSLARADAVAELVDETVPRTDGGPAPTVLVVGVVNSLLDALRRRGLRYMPCDLVGDTTQWDEPIHRDALSLVDSADAVLASGMTIGNGTADALLDAARGRPVVLFAQTASALSRELWRRGEIAAASAEPYPFFWLTGTGGDLHLYRGRDRAVHT